jgi:hypothetical protein
MDQTVRRARLEPRLHCSGVLRMERSGSKVGLALEVCSVIDCQGLL